MIYVGRLKALNEARRWQRIVLHVEKKGLKISEGCKHDWESCGIKGTVLSTGLKAGSFPCCSEQRMGDNWEAEQHHQILQPVPPWLHLSCSTAALWLASGLEPQKYRLDTKHSNRIFSLFLNLVTPNTMGQIPSYGNKKIFLYWAVKAALTCQISSVLLVSTFLFK